MRTAIIAITTKSSISVKPFRPLVMSRPFNEAHRVKRPEKTISLVPQRDRGRHDAERDESNTCMDERSLGRNAGDERSRADLEKRIGQAHRAHGLVAGRQSPRPTVRGDTV